MVAWAGEGVGSATPGIAPAPALPLGPDIDPVSGAVTFVLPDDPEARPTHVWFHLKAYGADTAFRRAGGQWLARIPRPAVDRLEYLIVVADRHGHTTMLTDPTNPRLVRGVFGDHSLLEWPAYRVPWWIAVADAAEAQAAAAYELPAALRIGPTEDVLAAWATGRALPPGEGISSVRLARRSSPDDRRRRAHYPTDPLQLVEHHFERNLVVDTAAEVAVTGRLHVPAGSQPADPLPLLVVHDGPEYADLAQLLRYLATLTRIESGLRSRVLLLQPIDRDRSYSASPAYARALCQRLLPEVRATVNTVLPVVGVGASLGGLSLLHAAHSYPGTFGGIFSQSGSYFRPRTDAQERGYRFYNRIVRFVDVIDADPGRLRGLVVSMTCGTGEENLANNRETARRLARSGVPTELTENPDGHNYTGWRDCLDPALRDLLRELWLPAGNGED
ncbi:MAG: alpha/beta hydrolase [Candidatus Nanopelagicales bacterium]